MIKKFFVFSFIFFSIFLIGCQEKVDYESVLNKALDELTFSDSYTSQDRLPSDVVVNNVKVTFTYETEDNAISSDGVIAQVNEEKSLSVTVSASCAESAVVITKQVTINISTVSKDYEKILTAAANSINIASQIDSDITLPTVLVEENETINITWESNNSAINNTGKVTQGSADVLVTLKATLSCEKTTITFEKEFNVTVLKKSIDNTTIISKALELLDLPSKTFTDLNLPNSLVIDNYQFLLTYKSNNLAISDDGKILPDEKNDLSGTIEITLTSGDVLINHSLEITVESFESYVKRNLDLIIVPASTSQNIELIKEIGPVKVQWSSSNTRVLTNAGVCNFVSSATNIKLDASLYLDLSDGNTYFYDLTYDILVEPFDALRRYEMVIPKVVIPDEAVSDIVLLTEFDYDVIGSWESTDTSVITTIGKVYPQDKDVMVTLTLTLSCNNGESKSYEYEVLVKKINESDLEKTFLNHNLIDRTTDYVVGKLNNLIINSNGKVELASSALEGSYESKIFNTQEFTSAVGCWSCVTSPNATIEVEFSVRVDGVWSKYFTYGVWGLGKTNTYYNDSDAIARINVDEIDVLNNKRGDGIKYKVTLKRNSLTTDSPVLSLVSCALEIPNYVYNVDTTNLPDSFDIEVPRLYQHDVPTIGGSICSATTTTMLLKYKGFSFTDKGYAYEHQYMANMVADPGHNSPTYGNWSYNMATAGAFGVDAYVARMYSWDEVRYHLVNVGPLGASIKGTFGSYTTNGHLIVVRGYSVENGQTTVICNDPNIRGVYYTVTLQTFLNCWRNVVYVVE